MRDLQIGIRSMSQAVETLSGGQRQGVAVARSAAWARKLVIMDEPTAALGVKESNQVLELIRRVRDNGLPVILISHNMPHVFEIADRIHIHRLGKRVAVVDPKTHSMHEVVGDHDRRRRARHRTPGRPRGDQADRAARRPADRRVGAGPAGQRGRRTRLNEVTCAAGPRTRPRRLPAGLDSPPVPAFKAAYLIHGDDHGRLAERRARLRAMAEAESGAGGVEVLEGDACTPDAVVAALSTMTFALGRRFVIADGVERWKEADVAPVAAAMAAADPETQTVAFFAREESRVKAPAALVKAVEAAGGQIAEESEVRPRDLPRWLVARAAELGITLDTQGARALVAQVGDRRQRLLRELEKLALEYGEGARLGVEEVQASSATSAERRLWTLADALVAGDERTATRALLDLRDPGRAAARAALRHGPPPARRARRRRGARGRAARRAGQAEPADAVLRRRPAGLRRRQARRRGVPARAGADGRPRAREPRRGRRRAERGHRRRARRHRRRALSVRSSRRRAEGGADVSP